VNLIDIWEIKDTPQALLTGDVEDTLGKAFTVKALPQNAIRLLYKSTILPVCKAKAYLPLVNSVDND
jgi:hypothetical protein